MRICAMLYSLRVNSVSESFNQDRRDPPSTPANHSDNTTVLATFGTRTYTDFTQSLENLQLQAIPDAPPPFAAGVQTAFVTLNLADRAI